MHIQQDDKMTIFVHFVVNGNLITYCLGCLQKRMSIGVHYYFMYLVTMVLEW